MPVSLITASPSQQNEDVGHLLGVVFDALMKTYRKSEKERWLLGERE